jgi:hypothetical protein
VTNPQKKAQQNLHDLQFAGEQASRLQMPGSMPEHHRTALALLRAAYDDAVAINHLVASLGGELAGSAFSLLRPMNDKAKRGTWFFCCGDEATAVDFLRNDRVPKGNLAVDIEKHAPFDQFRIFSELYENAFTHFHSFTHGGNQIANGYMSGCGGIGASYPEPMILQAIDHAHAVGITVVQILVMLGGEYDPHSAEDILNQFHARFLVSPTAPQP